MLDAIRSVSAKAENLARPVLARNELTLPQALVLRTLLRHGQCTLKHLAESISVTSATATGIVDRLVDRRLVLRARSHTDRREVSITLSAPGRRLVDGMLDEFARALEPLFEGWSQRDMQTLAGLLRRLGT